MDQLLANELLVALVLRVNGNGDVAQHGLWTRGGDHDLVGGRLAVAALHHVRKAPQLAVFFLCLLYTSRCV